MKNYTVRLADNTVGTISQKTLAGQSADCYIGEIVAVHLHDISGNKIEVYGKLIEIIETNAE